MKAPSEAHVSAITSVYYSFLCVFCQFGSVFQLIFIVGFADFSLVSIVKYV